MKQNQLSQLFSIILLFFIILGGVFFVMPMRENIAILDVQKVASADELQQLQSQYDSLAQVAAQVDASSGAKVELLNAVPVGIDEGKLLDEIVSIADEFEVTMNSVSFSKSSDNDFGNILGVTANFKGSYEQLVSFLQKIENAKRLMRVTALSVQLTSTEDSIFNLSIETYYQ